MRFSFPGESAEYRAARDRLFQREIELRQLAEEVARERRALPEGGALPTDYPFTEGPEATRVRLSQLFGTHDTLALYSFMFGPERKDPCPMCTGLLDGLDRAAFHLAQRVNVVVVAESPAERLAAFARERGWRNLRLVSSAGTSYNRDYFGKTADGHDTTMLNVFRRNGDAIHHFWGSELSYGPSDPGQDPRGLDLVNPVFMMLDFTPEGRGDFRTRVHYDRS